MTTRKTLVDNAILFKNPERIPVWIPGEKPTDSDILTYDLSLACADDPSTSEWGFTFPSSLRRLPDGEIPLPYLNDWNDADRYKAPPINPWERLARIPQAARNCGDRYRLGTFPFSGFSIYRQLRGAEHSAVDFLIEPDRFLELIDIIFSFFADTLDLIARKGFHGIEFCDNFGDRKTSKMTLSLWRKMLKHRFVPIFKRAHELGMHIWFSLPGDSVEFFSDLCELGADVLRVESPEMIDSGVWGSVNRGKTSFAVRMEKLFENAATEEDVKRRIERVIKELGTEHGGVLAMFSPLLPETSLHSMIEVINRCFPQMFVSPS